MGAIAGGILGYTQSQGLQNQDTAAKQAALQAYLNINAPSVAEQQVALQQEQLAGNLAPTMEGTQQQGASALNAYQNNPATTQAQMNTLAQLGALSQGGLNDQDRAALLQIQNQAAGQAQASQSAATANMAQRGMLGGGAELAAKLSASQAAANQGAQAGLGVASQEQGRANQALTQQGQLAQSMQGQAYQQAANTANQQNAINQFNTGLRQQVAGTNTAAQNQAQLFNLQNAQNIGNTNTGIANQQQLHNTGLYQQQFANQMGQAAGVAGQQNSLGNYYGQQAQNLAGVYSGVGQGLDQGAMGAASMMGGSSGGGSGGGEYGSNATLGGTSGGGSYDYGGGAGTGPLSPGALSNMAASGGSYTGGISAKDGNMYHPKGYAHGGPVGGGIVTSYPNIPHYADGGSVSDDVPEPNKKNAAAFSKGVNSGELPASTLWDNLMKGLNPSPTPTPGYAGGGMTGLMQYAPLLQFLKDGGVVDGKAKVKGDSPKNDTVHAMLSPDEIVVPRSHTKNPEKAKDYIDGLFAAMGKHGRG